jgi:threonine/homoserine/homoserine lactone efflux protein
MPLPYLLLKAAGFGLAVAAPVGPMSLLCMRRTLAQGWRQGLATGAGIATAD